MRPANLAAVRDGPVLHVGLVLVLGPVDVAQQAPEVVPRHDVTFDPDRRRQGVHAIEREGAEGFADDEMNRKVAWFEKGGV